jgi:hypothetical protein
MEMNVSNTTILDNPTSIHEKNIIENKDKYILLNENAEESLNITEDLKDLVKKLSLGQMVHTVDFKLKDTMSAVELNHFKMDPHFNNNEVETYKKLLRNGVIKPITDLNYSEVKLH